MQKISHRKMQASDKTAKGQLKMQTARFIQCIILLETKCNFFQQMQNENNSKLQILVQQITELSQSAQNDKESFEKERAAYHRDKMAGDLEKQGLEADIEAYQVQFAPEHPDDTAKEEPNNTTSKTSSAQDASTLPSRALGEPAHTSSQLSGTSPTPLGDSPCVGTSTLTTFARPTPLQEETAQKRHSKNPHD